MEGNLARAYAVMLERTGEFPAVRDMVRNMSAAFWWYDPAAEGSPILHNGTACFVATGSRDLMVTCDHVYAAWLKQSADNPRLVCQLGGAIIDPARALIDRNSEVDLATFEIGPATRAMTGATLHTPRSWPPQLAVGEAIMAGGYPGLDRRQIAATPVNMTHWLFRTFAKTVDRVHDNKIALHIDSAEAFSTQGFMVRASPDLGGSSGGPVVRINPNADLIPCELVGFIYEYHAEFELLYARPATLIDERGRISLTPA